MPGLQSIENGKKGGRPKGSKAKHTLEAEAGKMALIKAYMENIVPINQALINKALTGDVSAIKELHDRVHGKALQAIEHSGEMVTKVISVDE